MKLDRIDTIVTDMDGTLLSANSELSDYTVQVMQECKRRGIRLIPASGRTHASMHSYLCRLDTGMPYIGGNGAEIVGADHRLIQQLTLEVGLAREICAAMKEAGFYVQIYGDDAFYYEADCEAANNYKISSRMRGEAVGDLCSFLNFGTPKVLSVNDPADVEKYLPVMSRRFAGRATFTVSEPYFLEAEPIGATKGEALRRLADMRGDILPERTLAFGDSLNDLSLLSFTPHSVAMGNAREELKQAAAYVCGRNTEDGLAHFVEEHVLRQ